MELVRESGPIMKLRKEAITAEGAAELVRAHIGGGIDREHFVVVLLNTRLHVIGVSTIAIGPLDTCPAHCREVFKPAILAGAKSVILAHNHPSGDAMPSAEDVALTARMIQAGELLDIEVLDHVVIGEPGAWVSMRHVAQMAQAQATEGGAN